MSRTEDEMGVIIGVVVGYALGTRAGEEGWQEFKEAWKVISTSQEVRDLLGLARDLVMRGNNVLAPRDERTDLRPVA
jgi:hypothetical protein